LEIASANELTKIVGQNRMGLLLFRLWHSKLWYGINVFKVQAIIPCPKLTQLPKLHKLVVGAVNVRGNTISVIDLSYAITGKPTPDLQKSFLVIAEYNRSVNGIIVSGVDRIINISWAEIQPPPKAVGKDVYLSAVTKFNDTLIEIVDIEKILSEISPLRTFLNEDIIGRVREKLKDRQHTIMIADDSSLILKQVEVAMKQVGINLIKCTNGKEAYEVLCEYAKEGPVLNKVQLLVSDVEMPEMDGYTLTSQIRANPALKDLYVIIHTSMSGAFNFGMIKKIGANDFVPKFNPNELTSVITHSIEKVLDGAKGSEVVFTPTSVEELNASRQA